MHAWLKHADAKTLLLPDRTNYKDRIYTPHNSGADLYPYLILTSRLTDPEIYSGRMLHMQDVSQNWERTLEGTVARYFFLGEYFYPYFILEHERAIERLDRTLRTPEIAPLLDGLTLPDPIAAK